MLCMVIAVVLYCALTFSASIAGYVYANKINSSYEVKNNFEDFSIWFIHLIALGKLISDFFYN